MTYRALKSCLETRKGREMISFLVVSEMLWKGAEIPSHHLRATVKEVFERHLDLLTSLPWSECPSKQQGNSPESPLSCQIE